MRMKINVSSRNEYVSWWIKSSWWLSQSYFFLIKSLSIIRSVFNYGCEWLKKKRIVVYCGFAWERIGVNFDVAPIVKCYKIEISSFHFGNQQFTIKIIIFSEKCDD